MSRTTMAERDDRDELPRVSIDTFQDWMRIKSNIKVASEATLDAKLAQLGLLHQRDIFLAHLNQVRNSFECTVRAASEFTLVQ